jgi:hypothetical protein
MDAATRRDGLTQKRIFGAMTGKSRSQIACSMFLLPRENEGQLGMATILGKERHGAFDDHDACEQP